MFQLYRFLRPGQKRLLSSIKSTNNGQRLAAVQSFSTSSVSLSSNSDSPPSLDKVLVANRGEIACRVLRTCQRLGIPTVALYSNADGPDSLHVRMADECYLIGNGPSPGESYLLQDEVLRIANQTGAEAIHPGYGFLSENASFAQNVEKSGMKFVGPPASAITAMGSKSQSKAIMERAGVPTTPGYYGDDNQSLEYLLHQAVTHVGFPLLIKAVMGGGGKGMRLVWNENEFAEALASCQRESQSAFGDSSVLLEKYLVRPRHVEVQVIADTHGNVLHCYERDCSMQRRHQKIIEEAPASDLDPAIRERLGTMGKKAAQAVGYVNAGTVEFLLDTNEPDQFYFCEMNTRLQVEHPITELITGIDLVEWQLRIAAGEQLPIQNQADVPCRGHALEARIYAENPARNFLPATGSLWHHHPPAKPNVGAQNGVRVDTGVENNSSVGVYYDPMISKLIVHDENREKAINKLITALKGYQIAGVPTNIEFLIKCANHPVFRQAGACNTGFLEDNAEQLQVQENVQPKSLARAIGALATLLHLENRKNGSMATKQQAKYMTSSPWSSTSGSWRMGGNLGRATGTLFIEGGDTVEYVCNRDGSYEIQVMGDDNQKPDTFHVDGHFCGGGGANDNVNDNSRMEVIVDGTQRLQLTALIKDEGPTFQIKLWPESQSSNSIDDFLWEMDFENPSSPLQDDTDGASSSSSSGTVKTPMPGKVTRVNKSVGDFVESGELIMVLEAMKMEHPIKAPRSGVMSEVRYEVNDVVEDGTILFVVEDDETEDNAEAS